MSFQQKTVNRSSWIPKASIGDVMLSLKDETGYDEAENKGLPITHSEIVK